MSFWKYRQLPHENLGEFSEAKVEILRKFLELKLLNIYGLCKCTLLPA